MAFYAPELRLMLGTVAAKFNFGWSSVIVSAPPTRLSQNRGRCLLTAQWTSGFMGCRDRTHAQFWRNLGESMPRGTRKRKTW